MSKERLEEIEKNLDPLGYGMGGHLISVNDIYWLVGYAKEQAERVEELERKLNGTKYRLGYKQMFAQCNRDYASLNYEKDRYKQALEFYANEKNYERAYDDEVLFDYLPSEIDFDNGKKARKALERE